MQANISKKKVRKYYQGRAWECEPISFKQMMTEMIFDCRASGLEENVMLQQIENLNQLAILESKCECDAEFYQDLKKRMRSYFKVSNEECNETEQSQSPDDFKIIKINHCKVFKNPDVFLTHHTKFGTEEMERLNFPKDRNKIVVFQMKTLGCMVTSPCLIFAKISDQGYIEGKNIIRYQFTYIPNFNQYASFTFRSQNYKKGNLVGTEFYHEDEFSYLIDSFKLFKTIERRESIKQDAFENKLIQNSTIMNHLNKITNVEINGCQWSLNSNFASQESVLKHQVIQSNYENSSDIWQIQRGYQLSEKVAVICVDEGGLGQNGLRIVAKFE